MEGDNRKPDKTIGEIKYARERAHLTDRDIAEEAASARGERTGSAEPTAKPKAGDNRTPDKTIGEVKYAEERSAARK